MGDKRLNRNWDQLLQEMRVLQTGVQLLTGFLLILPFQPAFDRLPTVLQAVYLITVAAAVGGALSLAAPVAWHRLLFRRKKMDRLVGVAHTAALFGLLALGTSSAGVVTLIVFAVTESVILAFAAGAAVIAIFAVVWMILPLPHRKESCEPDLPTPPERNRHLHRVQ
jgi:cation transport ATPase